MISHRYVFCFARVDCWLTMECPHSACSGHVVVRIHPCSRAATSADLTPFFIVEVGSQLQFESPSSADVLDYSARALLPQNPARLSSAARDSSPAVGLSQAEDVLQEERAAERPRAFPGSQEEVAAQHCIYHIFIN